MPLLAEIADKMPTLETVWMTWTVAGLVAAAVTVVLALLNLWIGAAAVVVSAGIGSSRIRTGVKIRLLLVNWAVITYCKTKWRRLCLQDSHLSVGVL